MKIRAETASDGPSIRRVNELAFERPEEANLVDALGHPAYYPRFGFEPARPHGIETPYEVPDEAWMLIKLPAYTDEVRGRVRYPAAFAEVETS